MAGALLTYDSHGFCGKMWQSVHVMLVSVQAKKQVSASFHNS